MSPHFDPTAAPPSSLPLVNGVDVKDASSEFVARHAEEVASTLDGLALGPDVRERCREWVEGSLRRVHHEAHANAADGAVDRSLDEVLGVASRALKHVLSSHIGGASGVDDLHSLFKAVEITSSFTSDEHSVETVVEVVREAANEVLREIALEREARFELHTIAEEDHEWSLDELRARIASLSNSSATWNVPLDPLDRAPTLAITLLLTLGVERPDGRMWERARELLRASGSEAERSVLQALLSELCQPGRRQQLDSALQRLASDFGGDEERLWLDPALAVCEAGELESVEAFWPMFVERYVTGGPWKDAGLRERTIAQIARWPRMRVFAMSRRLQQRPGLSAGKLAPSAFELYDERLSPLYLALVSVRSTDVYGNALLAMVRRRTSAWSGLLAFRMLETFGASARAMLASLFDRGSLDEPGPDTRIMAVRSLAQRLLELPPSARNGSWVVPAIEALGDAPCDEARAAVDRVLEERRWLVAPAWSNEQREAARRVRTRLGSNGAETPAPGGAE